LFVYYLDLLDVSFRLFAVFFGSVVTALAAGIAFQRGLIPVSLEAMKEGIRRTIRAGSGGGSTRSRGAAPR